MYRLIALLAVAVLALCCVPSASADEYRAFWVDAWGAGVLSQSQVDTLLGVVGNGSSLGQIREANCNTVIVQVRRNCDANYPSSMGEPYMGGLTPSNFNSLQAVINAAHDTTGGKKRIEVHAWIVTFRTSGGVVYEAHNDTPTGSLTNYDNYWPTRTSAGAETSDKAFDPGHPLAEEYTVNVCLDIVSNFDVDGLNYDYIRFTAGDQGYNPTSIARYNARYGLTGQPSSTDDQFDQWRRDQISNFVRKVYAKVQAIKPHVKISGSTVTWNPSPTASTRAAFQNTRPYGNRSDGVFADWDAWMQEGILDLNIPMTYYNYASLPSDWTKWMNFIKDRQFNRQAIIGPGIYLNSLSNAILEIKQTRDASPAGKYAAGFCGYSYRVPYASGTWSGFSPTLKSQVTPTWDDIPDMPWKSSPTKGHISGTVTDGATGKWIDGATVSITGPASRSMLTDGTGFYAFIDLAPGTYTVTASKTGYPNAVRTVTVAIGAVTGNMYVTDIPLGSTPPPTISNVQATSVSNTGATITWTTNQAASSRVQYGLTTSYGSMTPLDGTLVTSHSMALTGLTPGTLYHYRVISANANGSTTSGDYTFTTSAPPVIVSGPSATAAATTATVTWTTNVSASSTVYYGLTTAYGSTATGSAGTSHTVSITGLTPETTYHYKVVSTNTYGTVESTDRTFTTGVVTPVISNVQSSGVTNNAATITWTTDITSTSRVEYGTTTSYGNFSPLDSTLVTSHSVTLSGLSANTTYHYRVISAKGSGTATSSDYTFTTLGPPTITTGPSVDAATTTATITWTTNVSASTTVHYGPTSSYGSTATGSTGTSHSVTISGLTAATTYHYKVVSTNAYGTIESTDLTFTTDPIVTEYVIDNLDPEWANTSPGGASWSSGSSSSVPKIGTDYLYYAGSGSTSTITRSCTWTPDLGQTGYYDVYVFYQRGSNRNTAAPYTVYYLTGQLTSVQVQYSSTPNLGDWFLIGEDLPFAAGTAGYVKLTNASTDTKFVSADAAKWVFKSALEDTTAPSVPMGLAASPVSGTRINLSWTASTDNVAVAGYKVFRNGVQIGTSATTSYSDTTCTPATTYSYQVSAYDAADNESAKCTAVQATTPDTIAPSVPTGLSASPVSGTRVNLSWTASTDNVAVSGYKIFRNGVQIGTSPTPSYSDLSCAPATTYSYQVSAYDVAGNESAKCTAVQATTPDTVAPSVPAGLSAAAASATTVNLTWSASTDNVAVTGYKVYRDGIQIGTSATTSYSDTTCVAMTTYSYQVSAYDAAGNESAKCTAVQATTLDGTAPVMTSVTDEKYTLSTTTLVGSWAASEPESSVARYEYAVGSYPEATDLKAWTSAGTATSATISGLSLGVSGVYYISARAVNTAGLTSEAMCSEGVTVAQPVTSIANAKGYDDGTPVAIPLTSVTAKFSSAFYIQDASRASGIRVECPGGPAANYTVQAFGRLSLLNGCERALTDCKIVNGALGATVKPLLMNLRWVGGAPFGSYTPGVNSGIGVNNVGLLVAVGGKVTALTSDGFYVDDGSGLQDDSANAGIKVWTGTPNSASAGQMVVVTGVVSCRAGSGGLVYPMILAREIR